MHVVQDGNAVIVTLSERNLADLTSQVQDPAPGIVGLVRDCEDGDGGYVRLLVFVEPDDVHYGDRTPGAGSLGPVQRG